VEYSQEELIESINNNRTESVWNVLDIKLVEAQKDRVVATMPIGPNHRQQVGYLHGSDALLMIFQPGAMQHS